MNNATERTLQTPIIPGDMVRLGQFRVWLRVIKVDERSGRLILATPSGVGLRANRQAISEIRPAQR